MQGHYKKLKELYYTIYNSKLNGFKKIILFLPYTQSQILYSYHDTKKRGKNDIDIHSFELKMKK